MFCIDTLYFRNRMRFGIHASAHPSAGVLPADYCLPNRTLRNSNILYSHKNKTIPSPTIRATVPSFTIQNIKPAGTTSCPPVSFTLYRDSIFSKFRDDIIIRMRLISTVKSNINTYASTSPPITKPKTAPSAPAPIPTPMSSM